jgi:hypothetical protein
MLARRGDRAVLLHADPGPITFLHRGTLPTTPYVAPASGGAGPHEHCAAEPAGR